MIKLLFTKLTVLTLVLVSPQTFAKSKKQQPQAAQTNLSYRHASLGKAKPKRFDMVRSQQVLKDKNPVDASVRAVKHKETVSRRLRQNSKQSKRRSALMGSNNNRPEWLSQYERSGKKPTDLTSSSKVEGPSQAQLDGAQGIKSSKTRAVVEKRLERSLKISQEQYHINRVVEDAAETEKNKIEKEIVGPVFSTQASGGGSSTEYVYDCFYDDDWYEPNDYRSSAYDITGDEGYWLSSIAGYGIQCDDDYYKIYVEAGYQELTVELEFSDYEGDIDLKVYDEYGSQVASSTSTSDDEYINVDLDEPGFYYIKVYYDDEGNDYDLLWYTDPYGTVYPDEDYYHPNDSRYYAYSLTAWEDWWLSSIHGDGVLFDNDEDWYEIYVDPEFLRVIVDLRFDDYYGDLELKLYDDNGYQVASSTSSSDDELIDVEVDEPGYYYIKIYDFGSLDYNLYDLKWYTLFTGPNWTEDSYEPNDSLGYAKTLSENITYNLNQFDDDYFRITIDPDYQRVQVDVRFYDDEGDIDVQLLDADGYLVEDSLSVTDNEYIDLIVDQPGTYYIRVFGDNAGNPYTLEWDDLIGGQYDDNYEENDYRTQAFDLRGDEFTWLSNVSGYGEQWDDDWYKIEVFNPYNLLTVNLDFTHAQGDLELAIYNDLGTRIDSSVSANDNETLYLNLDAGVYYIKVYGAGSLGNTGNYYDLYWETNALPYEVQMGHSASYYDPAKSGQGVNVDYIYRSGRADDIVVYWYTYKPGATNTGKKVWMAGMGTKVDGSEVVELDLFTTPNGVFDQGAVSAEFVGTAVASFNTCNSLTINYSVDLGPLLNDLSIPARTGLMNLVRLTPARNFYNGSEVVELCYNPDGMPATTADPDGDINKFQMQHGHQGSWYEPATTGQGLNIEYVQRNGGQLDQAIAYWYTYNPAYPDEHMWIIAMGDLDGFGDIEMTLLTTPDGQGVFDAPPTVGSEVIGTAYLQFNSCGQATWEYYLDYPAAGSYSGVINLERLSEVPYLESEAVSLCDDSWFASQSLMRKHSR